MGKNESRLAKYVDWALMALLSGIATYGVSLISKMSDNISDLNAKVAVVITSSANQAEQLRDLSERVRSIEIQRRR